MEIEVLETLLVEFDTLPKIIRQSTYLELCKYPRRRFEEICSRLLCFYLSPEGDHGFGALFLSSLLELISPHPIPIRRERVVVNNEEKAEGKRLDILVYSDTFVIGIENKISANLYNPLEIYRERIELFGRDACSKFKVVLSLKKVKDKAEQALMTRNGFVNVTYLEYFNAIKKNIALHLNDGNEKYLIFLMDFMHTIENMDATTAFNKELSEYLFTNTEKIENLINLFERFNQQIRSKQIERIDEIREKISEITKREWWAYEGWDLGFNLFDGTKPLIGIEASFVSTKNNPLGIFNISITTWSLQA